MIHPARRSADGPGGKQTLLLRRSLMPSEQAAPLPLFGSRDQIRPQGISFHRPTDRQKVLVVLDRKRFESPLVQVLPTRRLTVSMPSLRVRQCQPADKFRQLAVFFGPDDEVPVISHHTRGKQPNPASINGFFEDSFKRLTVLRRQKDRRPRMSAIENVVNPTTRSSPFWSSHCTILLAYRRCVKNIGS